MSQNRTTHGLCGRFRVLSNESQAEYDALLARFMQSEQPADDVERELVAKMARHTWLSQRAHDGAYQRAAAELLKRRKDRMLAERGFESQKRAAAEETRREKRQNQRDELESYKVATAKLRFETALERSSKVNATPPGPKSGKIAA